jgi:hypothetical protein
VSGTGAFLPEVQLLGALDLLLASTAAGFVYDFPFLRSAPEEVLVDFLVSASSFFFCTYFFSFFALFFFGLLSAPLYLPILYRFFLVTL